MADIRNLINKMKVPIANQSNPYTRNGIPNVNLAETGQFVNSFMPISGDIQSGLLAAQDVKQGNYGSAALNSLGLLPFIPAIGGTFIGKSSKLWNPAKADLAQQLEKAGVSAEDIWRQTGTVRGPDKLWRQEISDASSKMIKKPTLDVLKKNPELSTIMQHPELYSAYDDIALAKVVPSYESQGFYQLKDNSIGLSPMNESANWQMKIYKDTKKKTLLHEGQHAIQEKEGFAKGGSPEAMRDVALDMLRRDVASGEIPSTSQAMEMLPMAQQNAYRRLAGEAESRLTEARRDLTPAQRLQYFPYNQGQYGLDVPYESLIVRGLLND